MRLSLSATGFGMGVVGMRREFKTNTHKPSDLRPRSLHDRDGRIDVLLCPVRYCP